MKEFWTFHASIGGKKCREVNGKVPSSEGDILFCNTDIQALFVQGEKDSGSYYMIGRNSNFDEFPLRRFKMVTNGP